MDKAASSSRTLVVTRAFVLRLDTRIPAFSCTVCICFEMYQGLSMLRARSASASPRSPESKAHSPFLNLYESATFCNKGRVEQNFERRNGLVSFSCRC